MLYTEFIVDTNNIFKLRLTMIDLVMIERRCGKSPLAILSEFSEGNMMLRSDMIMILDYAIQEKHTLNDTYLIYDRFLECGNTDEDFANVMLQVFKDAGFFKDVNNSNQENHSANSTGSDNIDLTKMEEEFNKLLDACLGRGMSEELFWKSTYGEILNWVDSSNRMIDSRMKEKALFDHKLADLIGISVNRLFSRDGSYPPLEEAYPAIFGDEKSKEQIEEAKARAKVEEMKSRMLEYMHFNNSKRRLNDIQKNIDKHNENKI